MALFSRDQSEAARMERARRANNRELARDARRKNRADRRALRRLKQEQRRRDRDESRRITEQVRAARDAHRDTIRRERQERREASDRQREARMAERNRRTERRERQRRERTLYRDKRDRAREEREFRRRYGRRGPEVYGRTIGKVAREQAARNPRGVKIERVRPHGSHSRTGKPERVGGHRATIRADPPQYGYLIAAAPLADNRRPSPDPPDPPAWRHEDIRSPTGYVRIRTVRVGDHEVRVGVLPSGKTEAISVLHPRNERGPAEHRHRHPAGHHRGRCPPSCRAGHKLHAKPRGKGRRR